jgi:hypothetical protein
MELTKEDLLDYLKTQMIQDCESFEELIEVLDNVCPMQGSRKEYSAERLKEKIEQLRSFLSRVPFDQVPWNLITRTHGLRAKCMELFYYEKYEK